MRRYRGGARKNRTATVRGSTVEQGTGKDWDMRTQLFPDLAEAIHALERRYGVGGLRRGILTMLAGWIGYFLLINMFVRSLNKVVVPVLDLPLGFFLAMQGAVVVFIVTLFVLVKWRSTNTAPVRVRRNRR
jgi:putative solute:sodium symporter small subunit